MLSSSQARAELLYSGVRRPLMFLPSLAVTVANDVDASCSSLRPLWLSRSGRPGTLWS